MPITDFSIFKTRDDILADMLAALVAAIPDAYVGEDGVTRILFEIEAGQLETLYLAHQLLLEDIFVSTAAYAALTRHGDQYGVGIKLGTQATGTLKFTGTGATYVPVGTEVAYDPGGGIDPIFFDTTADGTIADPGIPAAPTAAINATAGNLNGTYEYVVTFITASGETLPSAISNAVAPVSQQVNLTAIPLGGTGTTQRKVYRDKNGAGTYRLVTTIANNTATTFTDNVTDGTVAANPLAPTVDTAHDITVAAQAQNAGVESNVAINTITLLTNAPSTLTAVTNPTAFTGGSDPEETEDFRARLLNEMRNPQTGSVGDLVTWSLEVDGVGSATVFENTPSAGTVTVRISGTGGTIPSAGVLNAVQAALDAKDIANITVVVASFTANVTAVTVDVTTSGTYTLTDVTPSVQQAITDYINNLDVGATLYISGIVDAVFGLPGIADVTVTTPATNQTTAATDKRTPGTITVT